MNAQTNQLDPLISEFATQADADSYDAWFRTKVQEALDSKKPRIPHDKVMAEMRAIIADAELRRLKLSQPARCCKSFGPTKHGMTCAT